MSVATETSSTLQAFSTDLANAVERAGRFVVAVHGRPRTPSSGIHWRAGVVVTTDHTLRQHEDLTITLTGGTTLPAVLAGRDPSTDLAILKVKELDQPDIQFADSSALRVGHAVLAVGRGLSASFGVISSLDGPWRTWRGGAIDQLIRPGLAIYVGFSGGALVDAQGRAIGLNTSGLSRGGGTTIPVSTVNRVVDELLSRGHIARGYVGLGLQPVRLPDGLAARLGLSGSGGLVALTVEPGGPADQAGLLLGDVLLEVDGIPLNDTGDLQGALGSDRIGKNAELRVLRGGVLMNVSLTIGERPGKR